MRWMRRAAAVAVLATGIWVPATAQEGSEGSRAFVYQVFGAYAGYGEGVAWPLDERRLDQVWTPRMAALIRRDRSGGASAPHLKVDPLCRCEAWSALTIGTLSGGLRPDLRRIIRVSFVNGGEAGETFVRLEGDPNQGWRIADVLTADDASLAEALEAGHRPPQDAEGAEAFVRAVYASYSDDPEARPPMAGDSPRVWSDRLAALMARNEALADGDLPYLDADPLCNCQDWGNLAVTETAVSRAPDGAVLVTTRFVNFGEESSSILRLTGDSASGWRIDDVLNPGYPGLADDLEASNRRMEAGGTAHE